MVHISAREALESRARELGCCSDPENWTDQQLIDAIRAEVAAAHWMEKFAALPTDEARIEAAKRLNMESWPPPSEP